MNGHERAFWKAVYLRAMGENVDCHETATQAVQEMRAAEATLAAEAKAAEDTRRGEAPFKVGDWFNLGRDPSSMNGLAEGRVSHVYWSADHDAWRCHVDYRGQKVTGLAFGEKRG